MGRSSVSPAYVATCTIPAYRNMQHTPLFAPHLVHTRGYMLTHVLVKVKVPSAYCLQSPVCMREMCGVGSVGQMHGIEGGLE